MPGPVIVLSTPEQKRRARFQEKVLRTQMFKKSMMELGAILKDYQEDKAIKEKERFERIMKVAEITGLNNLPAAARNDVANFYLGKEAAAQLDKDAEGGALFPMPLENQIAAKVAKYKKAMYVMATEGDPVAQQNVAVDLGFMEKAMNPDEIAQKQLDRELDLLIEQNKNYRAELRAAAMAARKGKGKALSGLYLYRSPDGKGLLRSSEQYEAISGRKPDPKKELTNDAVKEWHAIEEARVKNSILKLEEARLLNPKADNKELRTRRDYYAKLVEENPGFPEFQVLLNKVDAELVASAVEDGVDPQALVEIINKHQKGGGWFSGIKKDPQRAALITSAVMEGLSRQSPMEQYDNINDQDFVLAAIRKRIEEGLSVGMSPEEIVKNLALSANDPEGMTPFGNMTSKQIESMARGVLEQMKKDAASFNYGVPRPR